MTEPHISYQPGALRLLDQTSLPGATAFVSLRTWPEVAEAIAALRVRGAPAIGIAAAYAMAIEAHRLTARNSQATDFMSGLRDAARGLVASRPTAVNLAWAVERMIAAAQSQVDAGASSSTLAAALDEEARTIHAEDVAACHRIGDFGAELFAGRVRILTHCNTGDLATGGYGTALGVVRSLHAADKLEHVYVDETRPVLQGARLTAWELQQDGIPFTLIADSMAAHFMRAGKVGAVIVGADRIACNGDTANKIGTYALAVLARAHNLPFIVAAPRSTFDPALASGASITIEQRSPEEIVTFAGSRCAPQGATVANPAFDITPAGYITAIVTDTGVLKPPLGAAIARMTGQTMAPLAAR